MNYLRPCLVDRGTGPQVKALFHRWAYEAYVEKPSPSIGGSPGGQVCSLWGIVEMENGEVMGIPPENIRFLDNKFRGYAWSDEGEEHGV